ncbi:MAG: hypothetical protein ACI9OU_000321 [Candidatus Promineifilaceae bacterium]|jgi:hypothetical protein
MPVRTSKEYRHMRWLIPAVFLSTGIAIVRLKQPMQQTSTQKVSSAPTTSDRLDQFGPSVRQRWAPYFEATKLSYPPKALTLIGIKDSRILEVWASDDAKTFSHIRDCPILGSSGGPGPKQREGDRQVPEGLYRITALNPNSGYHLSLRIGYPNAFDRDQAQREGRTSLGGDIMIHGGRASIGCLAMGDTVAEDLFILAAETGIENCRIILTPTDFRRSPQVSPPASRLDWVPRLYADIKSAIDRYPR